MKIAFLNIYNGKIERGSEVFVDELASRLSHGNKITVYQSGDKKKKEYEVHKIGGIPFLPHQGPDTPRNKILKFFYQELYHLAVLFFTLKSFPSLWKGNDDWVIPVNGRYQAVACRILRKIRGTKILISGHAGVGFEDKFNIIFGKPDIFVALSPKALEWAKKLTGNMVMEYIPNGVDTELFKPSNQSKSDKPLVLCVSALLPYKRLHLLLKAVSIIPGVRLLIVGDGELKESVVKLGIHLLGDRFRLIPYVLHRRLPGIYHSANIFSLPSRESEAFGLVYLEAMACNLPVVAPDDINRKEIIGEAGLFIDPENIDAYSRAIEKALKSDFKGKPRNQAMKYSWDKMSEKYEAILLRTCRK